MDMNPNLVQPIQAVKPFPSGMTTVSGNRFFDNSTLDTMRVCPRKFYFRHIRKWDLDGSKTALTFGSAWHAMMDLVWPNPDATVQQAMMEFHKVWDPVMSGKEDFDLFPRTPGRATEMITEYLHRYSNWLKSIEVMAVEKPFVVPLSEEQQNLFYCGKWDKLYKDHIGINITDHKTSSSFASTWINSWSPNGQVDGYLYAGHMEYGSDFRQVLIDGALVQKTKVDFLKIPVERQADMLSIWKWEVLDLIELIIYHENALLEYRIKRDTPYLPAFPKCTTSCTSYYGACPYLNLCKFITNPEDIIDPPDGYVISDWKPFEISETPEGSFIIKEIQHA